MNIKTFRIVSLLKIVTTTLFALAFSASANSALVLTAGGLGVYDTVNNVTWTSDARLMKSQSAGFSGGPSAYVSAVIAASGGVIRDTPNVNNPLGTYFLSASDFSTNSGWMTWWGAKAWVNYLNLMNYGGSNSWSLPSTIDDNSVSAGYPDGATGNASPSSSQLAQLFYGGLGQVAQSSITSEHNGSYALFSQVQSFIYWSDTEYSTSPEKAWGFLSANGGQGHGNKTLNLAALAVSPGDISAVPVPSAAWLLGSGLLGVFGLRRRKTQA